MKYELVSTSVQLKGKVFKKRDNPVFDDSDFDPVMLDSLYKQGFIKPKGTKAVNPTEASKQYLAEKEKPVLEEKEEKAEPKPKGKAKK